MDMDRLDLGKLIIREDAESGSAKARNQPYAPGSAGRMRFLTRKTEGMLISPFSVLCQLFEGQKQ